MENILNLCNKYISIALEYVASFGSKYAGIATVLGTIIALLGGVGIKNFVQKRKEKKEFNKEFVSPVKSRSAAEQIDAYINASYNGVSEIEVEENE